MVTANVKDYVKMFGNIEETVTMARCACVSCNSCTCACSCRLVPENEDKWCVW
jgi:Cys-rich radical ribosomally synthesized peptide